MKTSGRIGARARQLLPISVLLSAAFGSVGVLYSLLPAQQRTLEAAAHQKLDAIAIAYLRVMLRAYPGDRQIRYSLVHALVSAGNYLEARDTLLPIMRGRGATDPQARSALLNIDRSVFRQAGLSQFQRSRIAVSMGNQIKEILSQPSNRAALIELTAASRELGRLDLVILSLNRLAEVDTAGRSRWLDLAARAWLSHGVPARAATVYRDIALLGTLGLEDRRKYARLTVDTFVSANEGASALAFAEALPPDVRRTVPFLERMIEVAQSQNDARRAQSFGRQLLSLAPESAQAAEKQLTLELAAGALPAALVLAERIVALAPTVPNRTRLAQIAEWNSAQDVALEQWTVLGRQDPKGAPMVRALEIARARADDSLWLELAARASASRALGQDELGVLVSIAQRKPQDRRVLALLGAVLARQPASLDLWVALSNAQQKAGNHAGALATLRKIPAVLAGPVATAQLEASLLARGGAPAKGLARLNASRNAASPKDIGYWTLVGDLSWETRNSVMALQAYRRAWDAGAGEARIAERMIEADNAARDFAAAIGVAREAYRRFDEPRWLELAMDSALQGERWEDLAACLAAVRRKPEQFERLGRYWLFSALSAAHAGRKQEARSAYQRALLLDPGSVSTRVAWLWFEIDSGERLPLRELLAQWSSDAAGDAAYWGPFAIGMMRLDRPGDALPWFERQVRAHPDDAVWSLEYAGALVKAGRTNEARQIQRLAYLQLKPHVEAGRASAAAMPASLMMSYAGLLRQFEGEAAAQALLIGLIERGRDPATAQVRLIDSLLAQKRFESARAWLRRARAEQRIMPAWQYLAVAQNDRDRGEIASILATRSAELSTLDRIAALRVLGRNAQALALAESGLQEPGSAGNSLLSDVTEQLRRQQSKRVSALTEVQQLGHLDLRNVELVGSTPLAFGRATVRLAHTTLEGSTSALQVRRRPENDLSATVERPLGDGDARMTLGANRQADHSMLYGDLAWTRPLNRLVTLRVDGAINKISEESALMRLIGKKNRLAAALTFDPGTGNYARVEIAGQRYATRSGERLGTGYRAEGEFGSTPFRQYPQIRLWVSGSLERNALADGPLPLPAGVVVAHNRTIIGDAVPAKFAWAGVGGTILFGEQKGVPGRFHGAVDALVGRQWPGSRSAYSLRARLVLPLTPKDDITLDAVHSNVQKTAVSAANRRLQLSYVHRF